MVGGEGVEAGVAPEPGAARGEVEAGDPPGVAAAGEGERAVAAVGDHQAVRGLVELGDRPPGAREQAHARLAEGDQGQAVGEEGGVGRGHGADVGGPDLDRPGGLAGGPRLAAAERQRRRVGAQGAVVGKGDELAELRRRHARAEAAGVAGDRPHRGARQGGRRRCARPLAQGVGEGQAPRRPLGAPALEQHQRLVARRRELLGHQGQLARQHAAGGRAPLVDRAVHPGERLAAGVVDRPDRLDRGDVVPGLGEVGPPEQAQRPRLLQLAAALEAGHRIGEGAGAAGEPERALAVAGQEPLAHHQPRRQLARLRHLGGQAEAAVALEEGDRLLVGVQHLGEDERRLLDAILRLQALEGGAVEAFELAEEVGRHAEDRPGGGGGRGVDLAVGARRRQAQGDAAQRLADRAAERDGVAQRLAEVAVLEHLDHALDVGGVAAPHDARQARCGGQAGGDLVAGGGEARRGARAATVWARRRAGDTEFPRSPGAEVADAGGGHRGGLPPLPPETAQAPAQAMQPVGDAAGQRVQQRPRGGGALLPLAPAQRGEHLGELRGRRRHPLQAGARIEGDRPRPLYPRRHRRRAQRGGVDHGESGDVEPGGGVHAVGLDRALDPRLAAAQADGRPRRRIDGAQFLGGEGGADQGLAGGGPLGGQRQPGSLVTAHPPRHGEAEQPAARHAVDRGAGDPEVEDAAARLARADQRRIEEEGRGIDHPAVGERPRPDLHGRVSNISGVRRASGASSSCTCRTSGASWSSE